MRAAVFLDKDGTLVENRPHDPDVSKIVLTRGAGTALRSLSRRDYALLLVSNQQGIGRGLLTEDDLHRARARIAELLSAEGVILDGFYWCAHWPWSSSAHYAFACSCRKPAPGMLLRAASEHDIDLAASWMIGDILDDVEAGRRSGCRTILIDNGNETEWQCGPLRHPHRLADGLVAAADIILASARSDPRCRALS